MSDVTPTTGLLLDGVFASEAIDSSGEILSVKGMDITTFDEGKGLANYEHKDSSGDSNGQEIVGKVVYARKIFNEDDCLDERQKLFWNRTKLPFLYGVVRLYDAAGHDGAKALAASIRDSVANDEPIVVGFSIEGATLDRDGNKLKSTIARMVALTTKPCNKQAVSGVLADPHAPEGFSKNPENAKTALKAEIVDPMHMRLGGSETEYGADMLKALTAGSYNAPPGALTGGAALQREDRTIKATAMAAERDWPKTGKFREFLKSYFTKAQMGDVSDDFLDHFSDLVESKYYRVKKAEEVIADLKKAGKYVYDKARGVSVPKDPPAPAKNAGVARIRSVSGTKASTPVSTLTNNGAPVKPNPKLVDPKFDEKTGTLHMPEGSFQIYIPSRDVQHAGSFHEIMNDPKVEQFHGYAMENWAKAHKLLKAGKLPPEVTMHAVLFSHMSPNTPVPNQELMYSHLVDSMNATGKTPMSPDWESVKEDWLERDKPQKFPDHSPEHWKRLESALRLKNNAKATGRQVGDIGAFMLPGNKFDNMTKYAKMHEPLVELMARHKADGRSAAEEMMYHKVEQLKWENRRRLALQAGKEDTGEYPGMSIAGLAPKTARYALAMMGAGNIHVPDTHFTRNLFGLNRELDGETIERIKKTLWNPRNTHILNGIDRYYAQHHDAVRHMLQHPKWGSVFEKPEDAVFPAFWKHWMAIVPHEQARGHNVYGYNELTDHRPYWDAVEPYLKKNESETNLPLQTAKQHAEWQLQYGEVPAMTLYFRHLLPKLLQSAGSREAQAMVRKFQELQVELLAKAGDTPDNTVDRAHSAANSAVNEVELLNGQGRFADVRYTAGQKADNRNIPDRPVLFQNRQTKPGYAVNRETGDEYHLLGHTPTHFWGVSDAIDPFKGWKESDLVKIPRTGDLEVHNYPQTLDSPAVVDADRHGIPGFVDTPEARALAHGFNFDAKTGDATAGAFAGSSFWAKAPNGSHVYVKGAASDRDVGETFGAKNEGSWNTARREGAYTNLARDFFGLGHMVPTVAVVSHPKTGQEHALISHLAGAFHAREIGDYHATAALARANMNGDVHKAAIMNSILQNRDRHGGNYMISSSSPEGKFDRLHLIDHNLWGDGSRVVNTPAYTHKLGELSSPVHSEAASWVQKLDPTELSHQMARNGVPPYGIKQAVRRLEAMKTLLANTNRPTLERVLRAHQWER